MRLRSWLFENKTHFIQTANNMNGISILLLDSELSAKCLTKSCEFGAKFLRLNLTGGDEETN